jgi:hypothetical protein
MNEIEKRPKVNFENIFGGIMADVVIEEALKIWKRLRSGEKVKLSIRDQDILDDYFNNLGEDTEEEDIYFEKLCQDKSYKGKDGEYVGYLDLGEIPKWFTGKRL